MFNSMIINIYQLLKTIVLKHVTQKSKDNEFFKYCNVIIVFERYE